jgi:hypothetical protein
MKGHTLMQAIARVNRVAANRKKGLFIDFNSMLKSLRKALATYGQGDKGAPQTDPLLDEVQVPGRTRRLDLTKHFHKTPQVLHLERVFLSKPVSRLAGKCLI